MACRLETLDKHLLGSQGKGSFQKYSASSASLANILCTNKIQKKNPMKKVTYQRNCVETRKRDF